MTAASFFNANYASKPGDARRSGRADAASARVGVPTVRIEFKDIGSQIEARLGVVVVGSVSHDPAGGCYFWATFLPGLPRTPRMASDAEKAKGAIAHKVREWCEAARVISVRGGR